MDGRYFPLWAKKSSKYTTCAALLRNGPIFLVKVLTCPFLVGIINLLHYELVENLFECLPCSVRLGGAKVQKEVYENGKTFAEL